MAGAQRLGANVNLFLSFEKLRQQDTFSKSDPFCKVLLNNALVGQTEVVNNLATGRWATPIKVHFLFEEKQTLVFDVFDFDNSKSHDHIGVCSVTLGNIMGSRGQSMKVALVNRKGTKQCGHVIIHAEQEQKGPKEALRLQLSGLKFDSKDWGGLRASDPYFVLERETATGAIVAVFKSEWVKKNNSPSWKQATIPMDVLCQNDINAKLKLSVFDWDDGTQDDLIGVVNVSVSELLQAARNGTQFTVIHPPTKSKYQSASYLAKGSGKVIVNTAQVVQLPKDPQSELLDFIAGGLEISLYVAIDFTASNGNPASPQSLHFHGSANQYEQAIAAVGPILQAYDHDGRIGAFGFGGVLPGQSEADHCFHLGLSPDCQVPGVTGLLQAYRTALGRVALSGPTYFSQVIQQVQAMSFQPEMSQQTQTYSVLLILTDGAISDMSSTIDAIVAASSFPLSIIIVGVGSADFSSMEVLDGDNAVLSSTRGVRASRDIVQFVPFQTFARDPVLLARETLHELPGQVCAYFRSRGIRPNPPLRAPSTLEEMQSLPVAQVLHETAPPVALSQQKSAYHL